ncbi:MAG: class I SAM-dependent methyltransferase [Terriglobales bacterium]
MAVLRELQENWEGLANIDPLWAICTDPGKRAEKWDPRDFFQSGTNEIARVLTHVRSLGVHPDPNGKALDFGCGVGRLTQALSQHFSECYGVDISPTMVRMAGDFHKQNPRCTFFVNQSDDLQRFPDEDFSFIYTSIVLQHIKTKYAERYLEECVRVLKPGGIFVFQVPDRNATGILRRIKNRVRLPEQDRGIVGNGESRFRMEMHCIPEARVRQVLSGSNIDVLDVKLTNSTERSFNGNLEYLDQPPRIGFVSKQYCVAKHR